MQDPGLVVGERPFPPQPLGFPEGDVLVAPRDQRRLVGDPPEPLLDLGQQVVGGQDLPQA